MLLWLGCSSSSAAVYLWGCKLVHAYMLKLYRPSPAGWAQARACPPPQRVTVQRRVLVIHWAHLVPGECPLECHTLSPAAYTERCSMARPTSHSAVDQQKRPPASLPPDHNMLRLNCHLLSAGPPQSTCPPSAALQHVQHHSPHCCCSPVPGPAPVAVSDTAEGVPPAQDNQCPCRHTQMYT
jgi:hypothetical protein